MCWSTKIVNWAEEGGKEEDKKVELSASRGYANGVSDTVGKSARDGRRVGPRLVLIANLASRARFWGMPRTGKVQMKQHINEMGFLVQMLVLLYTSLLLDTYLVGKKIDLYQEGIMRRAAYPSCGRKCMHKDNFKAISSPMLSFLLHLFCFHCCHKTIHLQDNKPSNGQDN